MATKLLKTMVTEKLPACLQEAPAVLPWAGWEPVTQGVWKVFGFRVRVFYLN